MQTVNQTFYNGNNPIARPEHLGAWEMYLYFVTSNLFKN